MKSFNFSIKGLVPSKKNNIRHKAGGGGYYDEATASEINSLVIQLKVKRPHKPLKGDIEVFTEIRTTRKQDSDNMHTTVLDALQKAGIISNDKDISKGHYTRIMVDHISAAGIEITILCQPDK